MILSISFERFRSKRCADALVLTGGQTTITLFHHHHDLLSRVFACVRQHHSARYMIDGMNADRKQFATLLSGLAEIRACHQARQALQYKGHYCRATQWGCRHIKSVQLLWSYYDNYWFRFGHFEQGYDIWVIHKHDIAAAVRAEVKNKGISTCPAFVMREVIEAVEMLPSAIDMRTTALFQYAYDRPYVGAEIPPEPTGIMHVQEMPAPVERCLN
jgi:hypothetical protein